MRAVLCAVCGVRAVLFAVVSKIFMFGLTRIVGLSRPIGGYMNTLWASGRLGLTTPHWGGLQARIMRFKHEFAPRFKRIRKSMKGRVRVRTGGSIKGTTLKFGDYGLRLKSNGIRMTATQLKEAHNVILREVKSSDCQVITRFVCNTAVCVKGNQTRMGKGKGSFSHWAARIRTGKVLFEIKGDIHERVVREALRKSSAKLPGICEIITKDSLPRVSTTSLAPIPEPIDYAELMNKKPTGKWANLVNSKQPMYMMYRGR